MSLDSDPKNADNNIVVAVNWLVKFVKTIITKVNEHAELLKFTQKFTETKANQEDLDSIKARCDTLEKENDEVRQRSLKGNLIISSPTTNNKQSLFKPISITDPITRATRLEDQTELCCRLILLKTGVTIPLTDITACHPLSKKDASTSYIIRISNRKPGSAWDTLAAGILTGRNKDTNSNFTNDNVYINFQLTKQRSLLGKAVRQAKFDKKLLKYWIDQNGKITVKLKSESKWVEVSYIRETHITFFVSIQKYLVGFLFHMMY